MADVKKIATRQSYGEALLELAQDHDDFVVLDADLDLDTAIAKMTWIPAQRIGLSRKGSLTPGCDADVVIFDAARVRDRSTFAQPLLAPEGIEYVFLGGRLAARNGVILSSRLGRAVRR